MEFIARCKDNKELGPLYNDEAEIQANVNTSNYPTSLAQVYTGSGLYSGGTVGNYSILSGCLGGGGGGGARQQSSIVQSSGATWSSTTTSIIHPPLKNTP